MSLRLLFRMPTPIKINAFINSIIPTIVPTEEQIAEALAILGMDESSFSCSYCGDTASEWNHRMLSNAALSQKSKGVADIDDRISRLEAYENWAAASRLDFESLVGTEDWKQHWENWSRILDEMKAAQTLADKIRSKVAVSHRP